MTRFESIRQITADVRRAFGSFKFASPGKSDGRSTDDLEKLMSQLAYQVLQGDAPGILDYMLGFQLVDRDDDNDYAFGVTVAKFGDQYAQAPLFFRKGQIYGQQLLFLPGKNMFVPLQEKWITHLINRKPADTGLGIDRQVALRLRQGTGPQIDFNTPRKYAQQLYAGYRFIPDAVKAAMAKTAAACGLDTFNKHANLDDLLFQATVCQNNLIVAQTYDKYYGLGNLANRIREKMATTAHVARNLKSATNLSFNDAATADSPGVLVMSYEDAVQAGHVAKPDTMLTPKIAMIDLRDSESVTKVRYYQPAGEFKLTNPTESGICDVLVGYGEFKTCAVLVGPNEPAGPKGDVAIIVEASGGQTPRFTKAHTSQVWVREADPGNDKRVGSKEWNTWFDALSSTWPTREIAADGCCTSEPDYPPPIKRHLSTIIVTRDGNCTLPFDPDSSFDGPESQPHVFGYFSTYVDYMDESRGHRNSWFERYSRPTPVNRESVLFGTPAGRLYANNGTVVIPDGAKFIPAGDDNLTISSSLEDAWASLQNESDRVTIKKSAEWLQLNDGNWQKPAEVIVSLVTQHGLSVDDAKTLTAQAISGNGVEAMLKKAISLNPGRRGSGIDFPDMSPTGEIAGVPTGTRIQQEREAGGLSSALTDPDVYRHDPAQPDRRVMETIQQAASSGYKDLFDVSMLAGMATNRSSTRLFEHGLSEILTGMSATGEKLFMLYAHREQFADRYGESDLAGLEDMLASTFTAAGEAVLFLLERSMDRSLLSMRDMDLMGAIQ